MIELQLKFEEIYLEPYPCSSLWESDREDANDHFSLVKRRIKISKKPGAPSLAYESIVTEIWR